MQQQLLALITNPFLITGVTSWMIAQVLKAMIHAVINKKFDMTRLFGDGGMPSGHSATVSSLAMFSALSFGLGSFEFAISAIFAIIVCHDAMGVRHETGKQAAILNEVIKTLGLITEKKIRIDEKLKEFVGHTPAQVFAGILVGIFNALVMHFFVFA